MQKLIAILIVCSLTFGASVHAKEKGHQDAPKVHSQKPKNVQVAPKQQHELKAPKTHVEKVQAPKTKVTKEKIDTTNVPGPANVVADDKLRKNARQLQKKAPLSKETVAKIQAQHRNFQAKPNTAIASVNFNPNYRIQAAQNWTGNNYVVFRSYQPQWHDRTWWSSHYPTVSLIGGGWYYWDAGYWYPAWGYDESAAYYPYDGPIYSGPSARPFDQVVADVQSALQEQGYYRGEIDGLLGPLTRQALAEYQSAQGLYATETIDQPTLDSLGLI